MCSLSRRFFRLFSSFATAASLYAQTQLTGRVLDPGLAPIEGAQVRAVANGRAISSAASNMSGEFSLTLQPGPYVIKIYKDGFVETSFSAQLPEAASAPRDVVLQIAPVRGTVTVSDTVGYQVETTSTATKTQSLLRDVPQSITVISQTQVKDQLMMSVGDVLRYVPGVSVHQGENNRDQVIIRGNSSSADFFVNGVRDDVQYYRDLYNLDRMEVLEGSNAMTFGRGGGGGVVNRVTKEALFTPLREVTLQGGSFYNKRLATDIDQPLGDKFAFRLNGVYENSDSFRRYVNLERYGISPTLTIAAGKQTKIIVDYENLHDTRVADRGVSSFQGRPVNLPISTYYGDPKNSNVQALVNLAAVRIEHQVGRLTIGNHSSFDNYDRGYQNFVPGAVSGNQSTVALSAYNNATKRFNFFNQTDFTYKTSTGRVHHTLLSGVEVGRQLTDNFRNTGYFNNTATSIQVPYANPTIGTPVTFRQSATDANNHIKTNLGAVYAQDQIELSRHFQLIAGVRFDHFDLQYRDNRTGLNLRRIDNLASPRAGLVYKPTTPVSLYASYSVSFLPSSGDQFSSLTTITQQVKPERFANYETGVKWDVARGLSLRAAVYRLDRTNTRSTDPNDPTRIVQTGSQRTNGFEVGMTGNVTRAWKIAGGYAYQDAFVTSATTSARAGAQVAQVPHNSFSLWNNYQILPRLGAGIGILSRSRMFAAIDNSVILPGYVRADAAVFFSLTEKMRVQANLENLLDRKYYTNADSNTNISPGAPVTLRVALTARF